MIFRRSKTYISASVPAVFLILILCAPVWAGEQLRVSIIHMNDAHAHYIPYTEKGYEAPIGGFGKAQTVIRELEARGRSEGRESLILFAGDLLMGTPFSTAFKGKLGVALMNEMKFQAMTVGNHEFDYGQDNLMGLKALMAFPLLSANIRTEKGEYLFQRFMEMKLTGSKTRVVIFGLTTTFTPTATLPDNVKGLVFDDEIETAKKLLGQFGEEDLIIALTHVGVDEDRRLAAACPKIDVIVGGHSHTALHEPLKVGNTLICQAGAYAKFVGRLALDVSDGKVVNHAGELVLLVPDIKEDEKIASTIAEYKTKMDAALNTVVGKTEVFLEGTRSAVRSDVTTNLGRLITYNMAVSAGADAGMINGGAIRSEIGIGDITLSAVQTVLPFSDTLVKVDLKGEDILRILQRSASLEPGHGGKLQTYGIDWEIEDGMVKVEKIKGQAFDAGKTYSLAISNFLATGGDGYKIFQESGRDLCDLPTLISDTLTNYIRDKRVLNKELLDGIK